MPIYVSSGVTSSGIVLSGLGDSMTILNGGTANSTTVNSGGAMIVSSGGRANSTTVNSGGRMHIYSGGTAQNVVWTPCVGKLIVYDGATVTYVSSYSGVYFGSDNTLLSSAAEMTGKVLSSGCSMYAMNGGNANDTVINGDYYGSSFLYISGGGNANNTTVNAHGCMHVYNGGTADSTTVNYLGFLYVSSGGTANSTNVNAFGYLHVSSGGTANSTAVNSTAIMRVSNGGTANSTAVNSTGQLFVCNGGTANNTVVNSDSWMHIFSGGNANNTTVNSSGIMHVSSGGTANSTAVNSGGWMGVSSGGTANSIVVNSPDLYVSDGGMANSTVVNSGGRIYVLLSGTAVGTVISPGGNMTICGEADGASVGSGGVMWISRGKVTGALMIASGAIVSAYVGSIIDFDISEISPEAPARVNDLSLICGTPNFTITVSGSQANGTYKLADYAHGFDKTVTICNTAGVCDTITVGKTVNLGGRDFSLNLNSGTLSLTVGGGSPVPPPVASIVPGDLDGDGRADVIMSITQSGHGAEGATGAWLIQSGQTASWGNLSQRNKGWEIFGTGIADAGKATNDIYVRSTGNVIGAWVTDDSGHVSGWATVGEFDTNTQILGLGDFNGDGQTDLLLRNVNGAVGCFFTSGEKTGWNYFQSLGNEWKITAIGDLNGDGRDDVVLKHDAGFAGSWLTQSDGTMAWANLDTLPAGFAIIGAGDFDGDGVDDVLLKKDSYYGAWLTQAGSVKSWFGLGDLGSVSVEQIADFDGDGKDDLRNRTAAGDLGAQLVKAADTLQWRYYGSVGAEWSTSLAAI